MIRKIRKQVERLWEFQPSGLISPAGRHSDLSIASSETYLQIKEKAKAVEQLYRDSNVMLPQTCALNRLILNAKLLSDAWLLNSTGQMTAALLFGAVNMSRIADVILPLREVPERAKYLAALTSGNLDLFQRQRSDAKNILWELELWSGLKDRSFNSDLSEPDIVVKLGSATIGIACKKLYSEKHVQNVLSEAVAQIESEVDFGIVALNIDDLLPANHLLRFPSLKVAEHTVTAINNAFILRHDRHFRKYLDSGRLLSALVSTAVVANIADINPSLNNVRRASIWTIPGLPAEKDAALRSFYKQFMQ